MAFWVLLGVASAVWAQATAPQAVPPQPQFGAPQPNPAAQTEVRTYPLGAQPVPQPALDKVDVTPAKPVAADTPAKPQDTGHLALLLPLKSKMFAVAAEAVQKGAQAAASRESGMALKTYAVGDSAEEVVKAYQDAVQAGARVIIGPLSRPAASALVPPLGTRIPTLLLNPPEGDVPLPPGAQLLWLSAEAEARQMARLVQAAGRKNVAVVVADSAYARRVAGAFAEEWRRLGGEIGSQQLFSLQPGVLGKLRGLLGELTLDAVFLAADPPQARAVRPYLPSGVPVYATSQIYGGGPNPIADLELNGVRFLDAPWLVQPDHLAVMIYPHEEGHPAVIDRLFALGIDAVRLALAMDRKEVTPGYVLDGVTGRISRGSDGQLQREPVLAIFRQGEPVVEEQ